MAVEKSKTNNEAQIKKLIEDRPKAVRTRDSNRLMSNHAANVLLFDVVNPLQYFGSDTVKERAEEWFSLYQGPIDYKIRDLNITAGDSVAFCHYLYRASGTMLDGAKIDMWVRTTVCYRKIRGTWIVVHEHESVPFDPETGKASLDIKP